MAAKLARAFHQVSDFRRAPQSRRAKNVILRAGRIVEQAKASHAVAALAGALPLGHQVVLRKICEAFDGASGRGLCVPVTSAEVNAVGALLIVRKLVKAKLTGDGLWIEYAATAAGRAILGLGGEHVI